MSKELRDAVWQNGPPDPTQRFVLMSLADRADDEGYCWPSHNDTAKRTGYTRRTVINAMKKLEADGWITSEVRYKRGHERTSNGTRINAKRLLGSELNSLGSEPNAPQVVNVVHGGSELNSPESYLESYKENKGDAPDPVLALQEHFVNRASVQPNEQNGKYEREWRKPLQTFLVQADNDLEKAKAFMDAALDVAWSGKNGKVYSIPRPGSLQPFYQTQAAAARSIVTGAADDEVWGWAMKCVKRGKVLPTDDKRLIQAIKAVGWQTVAGATEYNQNEIKGRLIREYRNAATA
jgi:DNA-binding Lrp family transcriptional regulator